MGGSGVLSLPRACFAALGFILPSLRDSYGEGLGRRKQEAGDRRQETELLRGTWPTMGLLFCCEIFRRPCSGAYDLWGSGAFSFPRVAPWALFFRPSGTPVRQLTTQPSEGDAEPGIFENPWNRRRPCRARLGRGCRPPMQICEWCIYPILRR